MKRLPKNLKTGDLIFVYWNDAYQKSSGWHGAVDVLEDTKCQCFSCGIYLGRNKGGDLMLAASWDTSVPPSVNGVFGRPVAMIECIKIIRKNNKGSNQKWFKTLKS